MKMQRSTGRCEFLLDAVDELDDDLARTVLDEDAAAVGSLNLLADRDWADLLLSRIRTGTNLLLLHKHRP